MCDLRTVIGCAALALLAGCAVGPDYERPSVDVGQSWAEPLANDASPAAQWWRYFADPTLDRLVERAQANNLEVRQALSRVAEARALRDVAAGGRYPTVDASGSVTRRRQSENGPLPITQIPGVERDQTIYETGFDAAWEVDLFGRTRRSLEAATARVDVAAQQSQAMRLTVAAEVARAYLSLRGRQRERTALDAAIRLAADTQRLVQRQFELGEVPQAQVAQATAESATLAAQLPLLDAQIRGAALALGALLGGLPESELALLGQLTNYPSLAPLPVGARADILRRRPDVLVAERQLAAATADIGVATAELFPRLSIGATGGFQSLDAGELFDGASEYWSVVPLVSWRLLAGGQIRANIRASEARAHTAALAYEATVLDALSDAEQSLSRYHYGLAALERQQVAVAATRRSYELAAIRYRAGDIALLELIDAERALRQADRAYAQTHLATEIDLVALYKALGGGWDGPAASGESGAS